MLSQNPGAGWQLVGAGDFDGNGTPDLVYWNANNGDVLLDYYSGATLTSYLYLITSTSSAPAACAAPSCITCAD